MQAWIDFCRVRLPATTLASVVFAALAGSTPSAFAAPDRQLSLAAQSSSMIWNAVAVYKERVFVSGPRWTGSQGPSLALLNSAGKPQPYPDAAWNSWKLKDKAGNRFVNVNAIHRDDHGGLWVIDTGAPEFGGNPLPDGAKAVRIDLKTNKIDRVYNFGPDLALPGSYVDDIRFHGDHAYLSDAGRPGLIVLNLKTGKGRRVLQDIPATTASPDRKVILGGVEVKAPDGSPLKVNVDPLEVSPDGKYLYFGPLNGPWSRIETRFLDDAALSEAELVKQVQPWADLPPVGGTSMDKHGNLYFTDLATDTLKVRRVDGAIQTVVQDKRLHWVDAPYIDDSGNIWLPVPQIDRAPLFNAGKSKIEQPVGLYRYPLAH